jgi:hypothetical protein
MLKTALAIFIVGGMAAWGQAQNDSPNKADRADRATAYYHYMLAHLYAEKAAVSGDRNREYAIKASENYKAAIEADPHAPIPMRRLPVPLVSIPAMRPTR